MSDNRVWNGDDAHGTRCAIWTIASAECTCGKLDYLAGPPDGYVEGEDEDCMPGETAQDVCPQCQRTDVIPGTGLCRGCSGLEDRARGKVIRPVPEIGTLEEELVGEEWRDEAADEAERGEV